MLSNPELHLNRMPHIENIQKENFEDQIVTSGNESENILLARQKFTKTIFSTNRSTKNLSPNENMEIQRLFILHQNIQL